ncbi:DNA lyase [Sulfurimonas lithotrophica]|uniref:DNA lyase n=1 Tax=Sulfurimonas lithotrophica TaxID=2590022 RepID=A0A5P8P1R0_9BACT|nr:pyrimidine dimer DNA glycosylase/endonuclease V [Sulfurimonas lithotrophica]QFR49596.1 DNA lyase [Sulfurimonas lithotrophica]
MRLWSIDLSYLDSKGLVALWREGLLAQNVLLGKTKGYKNHPQLLRFKNTDNPKLAISAYLHFVVDEADKRGYSFKRDKIIHNKKCNNIEVTSGQIKYEFNHLLKKLKVRDPKRYEEISSINEIKLHPLFVKIDGDIEEWEII